MINNAESDSFYYPKRVAILILFLSLFKLIAAASIELGTDESYYWLYSQQLQVNYFDHPPMVALWIRFFTANLLLQQYEVFIRLASIVSGGVATWFIYKTLETVHSKRAGWFAACLYNASLYASITAGLLIMPDAPQMVFYTLSLWMLARICKDEKKIFNWVIFGIASGLCVMSKIHGIYLWVGLGLFILICKRAWLSYYQLYVAAIIAVAIISPILFWNITYDFVTYKFHSERVVIEKSGINWMGFIGEIIGEIIINNPINVGLILIALFTWRKEELPLKTAVNIYNFIGVSLLATILFIALFRQTLPHWSGVAYVALIPAAAVRLANKTNEKKAYSALSKWSIGFFIFVLTAIVVIVNFYPGNFTKGTKEHFGKGDLSIDNYGWATAGKKIAAVYKNEIEKGHLAKSTPFVCNKWWGAHQEYYFCLPNDIEMIGLGEINETHQYTWLNSKRKDRVDMTNAFCVVPSTDSYDVKETYKNYYSNVDTVSVIEIIRNKKPAHYFTMYRLSGWKNNLPEIK
ncbi:glycosyltransferase family 39 protein [Ferruginibacter lapsinanis]|uniref:ArnT family glycosyltransferase n=1 Tax=Ferruginibacter lapsinanis TaxID=563172 RepID=UPI001E506AD1|nr:glycosyltransferase family 39 protein [Ferruginibacter lapsinanis]UEG48930.1 glycosyltransferase family 39 protein [Ferruginibacter lapsinanis]